MSLPEGSRRPSIGGGPWIQLTGGLERRGELRRRAAGSCYATSRYFLRGNFGRPVAASAFSPMVSRLLPPPSQLKPWRETSHAERVLRPRLAPYHRLLARSAASRAAPSRDQTARVRGDARRILRDSGDRGHLG